jgi:hypothetical protein
MSDMNYWLEPEKITESFIWFCFSKVKQEQLEGYVLQYKEEMRKFLRKELEKKNPLPPESVADEDVIEKRNDEIEMELIKNDNLVVNNMVQNLTLSKNDWKKILSKEVSHIKDYDER